MRVQNAIVAAVAAIVVSAGAAQAVTVATFADPGSVTSPLFSFNGSQLTGGWSAAGLNLQTPGLTSVGDFSNATFTFSPLNVVGNFSNVFGLDGGVINFFDSSNNPLLTITFDNATLTVPVGVGSSDFISNNVTFSGPILAGYQTVSNESFAFSFANAFGTSVANFSASSAFTSSADLIVPTPATAALLGLGGLVAARRRRTA